MKKSLLLSTALATALAALPAPTPVEAATDMVLLRCRSADGSIGYTDRSCAVFGADAVPVDSQLVARSARDEAGWGTADVASEDTRPEGTSPESGFDMDSAMLATTSPGRRSPAGGCARSPGQLATDLQASVALGDVNRIAESYHFAGMSSAAGERVLDRLQGLAGHSVVDSRYYGASIGPASIMPTSIMEDGAMGAPSAGAPGMVQLVLAGSEGAGTPVEFDVHHYAGCYFVSFA